MNTDRSIDKQKIILTVRDHHCVTIGALGYTGNR